MKPRLDYRKSVPQEALQALYSLEQHVRKSGLETKLLELVRMRASQINGCAYCLDMHSKDARAEGETEQRLYGLSAWRETPYYTGRERAALEWTEAVTLVSRDQVPDEIYERVRQQFSEAELISLTLAVVAINSWNRMAIAFRAEPGTYQRPATKSAT
ncbi:MAG: carboxymuconolactone decarboxylase family protein [Acidobacteriia bacterium]|nr:carboxymuconolactone decarboxylase family protein [Terriglobia bacterium]